MRIHYTCPYWGQEHLTAGGFIDKVLAEGYDGIEINIPEDKEFTDDFHRKTDLLGKAGKKDFIFIAQQVLPPAVETVEEYIKRMTKRFYFLTGCKPDFINSHTGKDYFSFDDNCRIIEAVMNISAKSGIPVLHETHRGRFTFHAPGLLPYLSRFPEMQLVADLSHWCTVSESMLQEQQGILEEIIPHISHIHARIGHEHCPQVNDPFVPEWEQHLALFISWWRKVIDYQQANKRERLTISPEFGPVPYMPTLPFTQQPVANQWKINAGIKDLLRKEFHHV